MYEVNFEGRLYLTNLMLVELRVNLDYLHLVETLWRRSMFLVDPFLFPSSPLSCPLWFIFYFLIYFRVPPNDIIQQRQRTLLSHDISNNYACMSDKLRVRLIINNYELSLYDTAQEYSSSPSRHFCSCDYLCSESSARIFSKILHKYIVVLML